jgi:hypothetical protein
MDGKIGLAHQKTEQLEVSSEYVQEEATTITPASELNYVASNVIKRAKTNPARLTPANMLALQRTIGNKAVTNLVRQTKNKAFHSPQKKKPQSQDEGNNQIIQRYILLGMNQSNDRKEFPADERNIDFSKITYFLSPERALQILLKLDKNLMSRHDYLLNLLNRFDREDRIFPSVAHLYDAVKTSLPASSPTISTASSSSSSSIAPMTSSSSSSSSPILPIVTQTNTNSEAPISGFATGNGRLWTRQLANCIAIVGYDEASRKAVLYHYNTGSGYSPLDLNKAKGALMEKLDSRGQVQFYISLGGLWGRSNEDMSPIRKDMKNNLVANIKATFPGCILNQEGNTEAYWNPATKTLTPQS